MAFSLFKKRDLDNTEERAVTGDVFVSEGSGAELLVAALKGSGCVTEDTAMQIPSIARCVNMIASAAAMLPVKMYRKNARGKPEEIKDDPRISLLNSETGDTMHADSMRYAWVKDYLLQGGGYAYIERTNGIPSGLFYISPSEVGVLKNTEDPIYKKFNYSVRGKNFFPFQLLKILRCSDGYGKGRGIIKDNSMIIDTAFEMIKFQRSQLRKGGSKKGFLKTESKVGREVIDEIKNKWRELYSSENNDSVMLLNAGIDFKEISSTSVEMQINQNIQTINSEIMKLFGTEDGILSEATVKNAVMPVLDVMEAAFDSDLLLESEKGSTYFAFDTRELTRGDIGSRYAAYSVALEKNFMQLDEVRELEDLPPLGINFITLGLNDVLLDPKTNKIYTPNTNAMVDLGSGTVIEDSSEVRFNKNHDPENGQFTSGDGGSARNSENGLDKSGKNGIIKSGSDAVEEDKSVKAQSITNRIKTKKIIEIGKSLDKPIFAEGNLGKYAKHIQQETGFYDVVAHGNPETIEFFGTKIDSHTLSRIIKGRKDYDGGAIRLLSCESGSYVPNGKCFAERLANELGVPVKAPTKTLWVFAPDKNGVSKLSVGTTAASGDGDFVIYEPKGDD